MKPLRIIFMGTAELACPILGALLGREDFLVAAVVTQPDRPKGRDLKVRPSAVKELAQGKPLSILQPERARDPAFLAELTCLAPELIVVAAYGQILPSSILNLPPHGCLNVHTSLLPKYRGAAPIQWALLNGDPQTGVTIMKMDQGMDTGPILTQAETLIEPGDDARSLHDRLALLGAKLLVDTIPPYLEGNVQPRPQDPAEASYTRKITKEDGRIDWSRDAKEIWNRIRAFTPWPGAFTLVPSAPKPYLLKIWQAAPTSGSGKPGEILVSDKQGITVACNPGAVRIEVLQLEGGRRMSAAQFLAGHPLSPGLMLNEGA